MVATIDMIQRKCRFIHSQPKVGSDVSRKDDARRPRWIPRTCTDTQIQVFLAVSESKVFAEKCLEDPKSTTCWVEVGLYLELVEPALVSNRWSLLVVISPSPASRGCPLQHLNVSSLP